MRFLAIVMITLLSLCGCDIFIEDWGGEGAPCYDQADCQKGMICEQHICRKAPDESEFGMKCQPGVQGSCKGQFGECLCFMDGNCYCTRPCSGAHGCDDIQIVGSSARCTLLNPLSLEGVCADWQWTGSYGNLCNHGDIECDNGQCVSFPVVGLNVCSTVCPPDCPEGYVCELGADPEEPTCGYAHWFGFWHACVDNSDCEVMYPAYPICKNGENCTNPCAVQGDCPPGAYCDNTPAGECVPDM